MGCANGKRRRKDETLPRQSSNSSLRGPTSARTPQKKQEVNKELFAKQCLERHNQYRADHGVDPLKLSPELNVYAQEWADQLASILRMTHRPNNKFGENLFMYMTTDKNHRVEGGDPVDSWYKDELTKYKFGTEPRDLNAGHLTQVLWASSQYLGVGVAKNGDYTFVVCNYNPPGNYKGEYTDNVAPLGGWKDGKKRPICKTAGPPEATLNAFINETVKVHNEYRVKHGVPPLTLDSVLTKYAQSWADNLAEKNLFTHRTNTTYGENLFWSSDNAGARVPCDSWYNESKDYDYSVDPYKNGGSSGSMKIGHFTQMIWKESRQIGVGRAFCKNGAMIVVANYSPRGNIIGHFVANVPPPKKR